jgi:GIY-YIG catalytic domain/NUMOD3 motif
MKMKIKNNDIKVDTRSEMINSVNNNFKFVVNKSLITKRVCFSTCLKLNNVTNPNVNLAAAKPGSSNQDVNPIVTYPDADLNKSNLLRDNKDKAVVYRWVNKVNGKTYVGSSVNLTARLYKYFSVKHLNKYKTPIHNALLKYGFKNFSLEILEYCEQGVDPIAGSSLGFKHSEETLKFFKHSRKVSEATKNNLSLAATGRILTESDKAKISKARTGIKLSDETRAKISAVTTARIGISVIVKNVNTNTELEYTSLTDAALAIGVSRTAVKKVLDTGKTVKEQFIVTTKN